MSGLTVSSIGAEGDGGGSGEPGDPDEGGAGSDERAGHDLRFEAL